MAIKYPPRKRSVQSGKSFPARNRSVEPTYSKRKSNSSSKKKGKTSAKY